MENSRVGYQNMACLLAHGLLNKLSVIIGLCDLLNEHADGNPECASRLAMIHETARSMAQDVATHQCRLYDMVRAAEEKHPVI